MGTIIGSDAWRLTKTAEPVEGSAGPVSMTEIWAGPKSEYDTFKAGYTFGQAHGTQTALTLHEVAPDMRGTFGKAKLKWVNSSIAISGGHQGLDVPPPGTITKRIESGALEIPLNSHPDSDSGDWDPENDFPGVEAYMVASPSLIYTVVSDTFTFNEADTIQNVFKRTTDAFPPLGLGGVPSYTKWLLWSREVEDHGEGIYSIISTFRYAPEGWDVALYPDAAGAGYGWL